LFHESASHTPRRCVKLACKQQVKVFSSEIILRCSKSTYRLLNFYVWLTALWYAGLFRNGSWILIHESA
jgi:hypothetical protein